MLVYKSILIDFISFEKKVQIINFDIGLTTEEREIVEAYFKQGYILAICCTSTLSSGMNFPARRVIIRTPIFNGRPLDIMSYKQMAGRAGRKGIDTCGESILMCSNANERKIGEALLNASMMDCVNNTMTNNTNKPASVQSSELCASIKRALLETIVSGVAVKKTELIQYVNCFIASKTDIIDYEKYIKWLNTYQFVDIVRDESMEEHFKPTQLGYAVVASSMAPDEGLVIFSELQKALQCFVLENELHIIYQITPINICDYWVNSSAAIDWNLYYTFVQNCTPDVKRVSDLVGVRQSFLLKMIKGNSIGSNSSSQDQKLLKIHLRFFTSLILNDLVSEVPFNKGK
jgi:DNA polymerase theta